MSYKVGLIKTAIKLTPFKLFFWLANFKLKGVAEVQAFNFDIDNRTLSASTLLYGEPEAINVSVENFSVQASEHGYQFRLEHASSNKPWLNNLLAKVTGKAWDIPVPKQYQAEMALVAELFAPKSEQ